ncbi:MAG: hypothetical protein ACLR4X_09595 [Clostridia bacterium]
MGVMIIKKEDIKEDVEIAFEDNVVYDENVKEPYIKFIDDKLTVTIRNKTIVDNAVLDKIELKKTYLDKFFVGLENNKYKKE